MRTKLLALAAVVGATIVAPAVNAEQNSASPQASLIDFVIMNSGYGLEQRDPYEAIVGRIAGKHGLAIARSVDVQQFIGGEKDIQGVVRVNIWKMASDSMQKLGGDEDYKSIETFRDRVHNMEALTLYVAGGDTVRGKPEGGTVLVDLVVMKHGNGKKERDSYEAKVAPIAAKYGLKRFASYDIDRKLGGAGPANALRLNLWSAPSPAAMEQLGGDPAYQALSSLRDGIHDMNKLTLFFATTRK